MSYDDLKDSFFHECFVHYLGAASKLNRAVTGGYGRLSFVRPGPLTNLSHLGYISKLE